MVPHKWTDHISQMNGILEQLTCTRQGGALLNTEDGFQEWRTLTESLRENKGTIYLIGNGASASMASHMAADLAKNGHLHTQVFSDLSLITAISNDMGYEHVFSEPLSHRIREGDMLIAISSSGNSPNVLAGVDVALNHDATVITLSGMRETNTLRQKGTLNFYIPATTYGFAESGHATILHHWMDMVEVENHN